MSGFDPHAPRLKPHLDHGSPVGALWFTLGSVALVEVGARAGLDAVVIDMQHGLFDRAGLEMAVMAACAPVLVRTRDDQAATIGDALDAGAEGVIVPLVETEAVARAVVAACRYPPDGHRSGGGVRPLADFKAHAAHATAGIIAGVMIETAAGVDAAEAIAASGVDLVFIGTGDLALSLGTAPGSRAHEAACARVLKACKTAKVSAGIFAMGAEEAAKRIAQGYALSVASIDMAAFEGATREAIATFHTNTKPRAQKRPAKRKR